MAARLHLVPDVLAGLAAHGVLYCLAALRKDVLATIQAVRPATALQPGLYQRHATYTICLL
jgi:hypothetical protein